MTFQSSALLGFSDEPTDTQLETGRIEARTLYRFHGGACISTYELIDWAKELQLQVFYVDGGWVRVSAGREAVADFLRPRMDSEQLERVLQASADRGEHLVLEAEEY